MMLRAMLWFRLLLKGHEEGAYRRVNRRSKEPTARGQAIRPSATMVRRTGCIRRYSTLRSNYLRTNYDH